MAGIAAMVTVGTLVDQAFNLSEKIVRAGYDFSRLIEPLREFATGLEQFGRQEVSDDEQLVAEMHKATAPLARLVRQTIATIEGGSTDQVKAEAINTLGDSVESFVLRGRGE